MSSSRGLFTRISMGGSIQCGAHRRCKNGAIEKRATMQKYRFYTRHLSSKTINGTHTPQTCTAQTEIIHRSIERCRRVSLNLRVTLIGRYALVWRSISRTVLLMLILCVNPKKVGRMWMRGMWEGHFIIINTHVWSTWLNGTSFNDSVLCWRWLGLCVPHRLRRPLHNVLYVMRQT